MKFLRNILSNLNNPKIKKYNTWKVLDKESILHWAKFEYKPFIDIFNFGYVVNMPEEHNKDLDKGFMLCFHPAKYAFGDLNGRKVYNSLQKISNNLSQNGFESSLRISLSGQYNYLSIKDTSIVTSEIDTENMIFNDNDAQYLILNIEDILLSDIENSSIKLIEKHHHDNIVIIEISTNRYLDVNFDEITERISKFIKCAKFYKKSDTIYVLHRVSNKFKLN